ncbi:predicted protein [Naegleria gruberi]|uniref:Predicted protein n=1 Tax=Naegleria gruberi TaxID=5762 RepID=D2VAJ7_NAEGR|nr:uncharacterized protein NAEGRDRAFT_65881 [Naegleria gruberi]EFC45966.1 predicted protein [Naegleria gruberi]|eukprot:XP_002678710.1 predicted protein [Naegleria gruberi strain NEG-M]
MEYTEQYIQKKSQSVLSQMDSITFPKKIRARLDQISNVIAKTCIHLEEENVKVEEKGSNDISQNTPIKTKQVDNCHTTERNVSTQKINLLRNFKYLSVDTLQYLSSGIDTVEMTHQIPITMAILEYAMQNTEKFKFQTLECLQLGSLLMDAFTKYDIKEKKRVFGDTSIRIMTEKKIHPYLLFMESQRTDCDTVFSHKDFLKICLTCRSSLKYTTYQLFNSQNKTIYDSTKLSCFALLTCPSTVFVLRMDCENYKPENVTSMVMDKAYRLGFSLRLIATIDMKKDPESLLSVLYTIFSYGHDLTLTFNGEPCDRITNTPIETKLRAQEANNFTFERYYNIITEVFESDFNEISLIIKVLIQNQYDKTYQYDSTFNGPKYEKTDWKQNFNTFLEQHSESTIYILSNTNSTPTLELQRKGNEKIIVFFKTKRVYDYYDDDEETEMNDNVENNDELNEYDELGDILHATCYTKPLKKRKNLKSQSLQDSKKSKSNTDTDMFLQRPAGSNVSNTGEFCFDKNNSTNETKDLKLDKLLMFDMTSEYEQLLYELFNINIINKYYRIRRDLNPKEGVFLYLDGIYNNKEFKIRNFEKEIFNELFEMIREMNLNPWKIINEKDYCLQQLEKLQNNVLHWNISDTSSSPTINSEMKNSHQMKQ